MRLTSRPTLTGLVLSAAILAPGTTFAASGQDDVKTLKGQAGTFSYRGADELVAFSVDYWCTGVPDAPDSDLHHSSSTTDQRTLLRADANGRLRGTLAARNTRFSEDSEHRPIRPGQVAFDLRVVKTPAGRTKLTGTFIPKAKGCKQRRIPISAIGS